MNRLLVKRAWIPVLSAALLAAGTLLLVDRAAVSSLAQETELSPARLTELSGKSDETEGRRATFGRPESAIPTGRARSTAPSRDNKERVPDALPSVLEKNADIAEHRRLDLKALPTGEEREALREMLSDPALITAARDDLLASNETEYSKESELRRMHRVKFFGNAIDWDENPEADAVAEAVKAVIMADNIYDDHPLDLQRSIAGDKVDLFWQLLHNAPDQAENLLQKAKGTPLEPLLAYARERYEADMLAFETPRDGAP